MRWELGGGVRGKFSRSGWIFIMRGKGRGVSVLILQNGPLCLTFLCETPCEKNFPKSAKTGKNRKRRGKSK
jgi:hypothetical protein